MEQSLVPPGVYINIQQYKKNKIKVVNISGDSSNNTYNIFDDHMDNSFE